MFYLILNPQIRPQCPPDDLELEVRSFSPARRAASGFVFMDVAHLADEVRPGKPLAPLPSPLSFIDREYSMCLSRHSVIIPRQRQGDVS